MPLSAALTPVMDFLQTWFLVALLAIEFLLKLVLNPVHQFGIVEDHDLYEEISDRQRSTSLSVASLVFAGLALILSENAAELTTQVEVFAGAFGLLLIAAFAHELTRDRRLVLTFQEIAFEYGLLVMVWGLHLLVEVFVPDASDVLFTVFVAVLVFRFVSVWGELKAHKLEFDNSEYKYRRQYLRDALVAWKCYLARLLRAFI